MKGVAGDALVAAGAGAGGRGGWAGLLLPGAALAVAGRMPRVSPKRSWEHGSV